MKYNTQELFKGSNRFGACAAVMLTAFGMAATSAQAGVTSTPDGHMTSSAAPAPAGATDHDSLAKKLANPIAAMISVPFQNNFDWGGGPGGDGFPYKLNFQPVIPFHLMVSKLIKIGKTPTQWQLGGRYYVEKPDNGPEWGLRFNVAILIPGS